MGHVQVLMLIHVVVSGAEDKNGGGREQEGGGTVVLGEVKEGGERAREVGYDE